MILTHDPDGVVQGIDAFEDAHPPVAAVFWAFRIMVGAGLLMLLVAWLGVFRLRSGAPPPRWLSRALVGMTFSGWVAVLSGWYTTEIGRQPFLVTGVLRTAEAVTDVPAANVGMTLAIYLALYAVLIASYISVVFFLARQAGDTSVKQSEPTAYGPGVLPSGAAARSHDDA